MKGGVVIHRVRVRVGHSALGTTAKTPAKIDYQGATTPPWKISSFCLFFVTGSVNNTNLARNIVPII